MTDRPDRATSTDALQDAIAAVTAWLLDDHVLGHTLAAQAIERDPIPFLDALGGLWVVVHDVAGESEVDIRAIIRDIALGVAQAETDDGRVD